MSRIYDAITALPCHEQRWKPLNHPLIRYTEQYIPDSMSVSAITQNKWRIELQIGAEAWIDVTANSEQIDRTKARVARSLLFHIFAEFCEPLHRAICLIDQGDGEEAIQTIKATMSDMLGESSDAR